MGLRMKNITRGHQFLGGAVRKNNIYGDLSKKGGLDNLQGAWKKIGRRVFLRGVDTSMHTMT